MKRLVNVLFWSIIAAAFIGPGTVTTAASSGAQFGYQLLWTLLFSTFACLILQEAAARITIVSGKNLGQAIHEQYKNSSLKLPILFLVFGAIILGSAAYEAGNILGGASGLILATGFSKNFITIVIGLISAFLLFFGSTKTVAKVLGFVVAIMGITFLVTAILLKPNIMEIISGVFIPSFPTGSGLLIIGLIGTTVVPYNLFLGSGLASGHKLSDLRIGLSVAIIFGGIISMGVLIVGAAIVNEFSFQALADTLALRLGDWARIFFAIGLFAAGFSSAITAPLASAITAKSIFGTSSNVWDEKSWKYRSIWGGVLVVGILFGLLDVKPIPAIIIAQALNGVILPFIAVFLFIAVNDRSIMGDNLNSLLSNIAMGFVVAISILLGVNNILKTVASTIGIIQPNESITLIISSVITILISFPVYLSLKRNK